MKPTIWTYCTGIVKACHWWIAAGLLVLMFGLGITSMAKQSAIVDEEAHIPAAYSYDKYHDYRLNPEHPPLIKVLAGIPLQFMHLQFPLTSPDWTTEPNGEWNVGGDFLYNLGNNASQIIFWARLPVLLLTIGFGAFLYWVTRRRYGILVGGLALFFYALSPNMIANGTLVTTDLGVAAFIFVALVAFGYFIKRPGGRSLAVLSVALALAQLSKFSGPVLYPFLLLAAILWIVVRPQSERSWPTSKVIGAYLLACVISAILVYLAYVPEMWNFSLSAQKELISASLPGYWQYIHPLDAIASLPGGQPAAQYLLGLVMVSGRIAGANVTYFFGQVRNGAFLLYFPALILLKTQLSFLILAAVTGVAGLVVLARRHWTRGRLRVAVAAHYWEVILGLFIVCYLAIAMSGNLNLGIRHILPIYPPFFTLVAVGTAWLWRRYLRGGGWRRPALVVFSGLILWYGAATIWIYPNYLAYFNELIGGPSNAYKYFSDSNIDWGQSLLEFKDYLNKHPEIHQVALDYFGGGPISYYFCGRNYTVAGQLITDPVNGYNCNQSRVIPWHSTDGPYTGQYIAVSETYLENDRYYAEQSHYSGYAYLRAKTPIAKIGYSIYLYKLY